MSKKVLKKKNQLKPTRQRGGGRRRRRRQEGELCRRHHHQNRLDNDDDTLNPTTLIKSDPGQNLRPTSYFFGVFIKKSSSLLEEETKKSGRVIERHDVRCDALPVGGASGQTPIKVTATTTRDDDDDDDDENEDGDDDARIECGRGGAPPAVAPVGTTKAFPTEADPPAAKKLFIHLDDFTKEEIEELWTCDIGRNDCKWRSLVQTVRREDAGDDFCETKFTNESFIEAGFHC